MKRKIILFSAAAVIGYVTFSSYSGGPGTIAGLDRTAATCADAGCHSTASSACVAAIVMTDSATGTVLAPGANFIPNTVYFIQIGGTNTASLTKWGFQVTVKKADGTSPGTFTALDPNTKVTSLSGSVKVVEHTAAITKVATGAVVTKFKWKAPSTGGTGSITVRGVLNAVNGDGTASNDKPSNSVSLNLNEDASAVKEMQTLVNNLFPNPAANTLNLSLKNISAGDYTFSVLDMFGRTISTEQKSLNSNESQTSISVSALAQGSYLLYIQNSDARQAVPFNKQ